MILILLVITLGLLLLGPALVVALVIGPHVLVVHGVGVGVVVVGRHALIGLGEVLVVFCVLGVDAFVGLLVGFGARLHIFGGQVRGVHGHVGMRVPIRIPLHPRVHLPLGTRLPPLHRLAPLHRLILYGFVISVRTPGAAGG